MLQQYEDGVVFMSCRLGRCAVFRLLMMDACISRAHHLLPDASLRLCRSAIDRAVMIIIFSMSTFLAVQPAAALDT